MGKAGGQLKRSFVFALLAALLASIGVLGVSAPAQAYGEGTILALVNQARAANNLGPLRLNSAMSAVSLAWANQMAANNAMSHNPNYSAQIPGGWTRSAENVAWNYPTPTATHNAWMESNGHKANILGDFTDIGIAFIEANGQTWAVENFGKYGASVPPPNPPSPSPTPTPSPSPSASTPSPSPSPSPSASSPSPSPSPSSSQPGGSATKPTNPGSQSTPSPGTTTDPNSNTGEDNADEPESTDSPTPTNPDDPLAEQPQLYNGSGPGAAPSSGQAIGDVVPLRFLVILGLVGFALGGLYLFERRFG